MNELERFLRKHPGACLAFLVLGSLVSCEVNVASAAGAVDPVEQAGPPAVLAEVSWGLLPTATLTVKTEPSKTATLIATQTRTRTLTPSLTREKLKVSPTATPTKWDGKVSVPGAIWEAASPGQVELRNDGAFLFGNYSGVLTMTGLETMVRFIHGGEVTIATTFSQRDAVGGSIYNADGNRVGALDSGCKDLADGQRRCAVAPNNLYANGAIYSVRLWAKNIGARIDFNLKGNQISCDAGTGIFEFDGFWPNCRKNNGRPGVPKPADYNGKVF